MPGITVDSLIIGQVDRKNSLFRPLLGSFLCFLCKKSLFFTQKHVTFELFMQKIAVFYTKTSIFSSVFAVFQPYWGVHKPKDHPYRSGL